MGESTARCNKPKNEYKTFLFSRFPFERAWLCSEPCVVSVFAKTLELTTRTFRIRKVPTYLLLLLPSVSPQSACVVPGHACQCASDNLNRWPGHIRYVFINTQTACALSPTSLS
jgi:hypothetical protein